MHYKNLFGNDDLENLAEEMVFQELYLLMQKSKQPWSNDMEKILDIAAIVLNRVPPKYVTRFLEKHLPRDSHLKEREELHRKVMEELPKAIEIVTARPRLPGDRD